MAKISITKKELDNIIQEEAAKFKKALALKGELKRIQTELKQLNENSVNEVVAGENMDPNVSGGVHAGQKKANFSTKKGNPYLKMEESEEEVVDTPVDTDTDMDMTDTEVPVDTEVGGDNLSKAAVWQAIEDLKMALNLHDGEDEDVTDVDVDAEIPADDTAADDEVAAEIPTEDGGNEESEDDEVFEFEEKEISENAEEPIEGGTPVQHAQQDTVNDNQKKVSHPEASGDLMESEKKRMAVLAGIKIMKG